jgi:hypothetical protein
MARARPSAPFVGTSVGRQDTPSTLAATAGLDSQLNTGSKRKRKRSKTSTDNEVRVQPVNPLEKLRKMLGSKERRRKRRMKQSEFESDEEVGEDDGEEEPAVEYEGDEEIPDDELEIQDEDGDDEDENDIDGSNPKKRKTEQDDNAEVEDVDEEDEGDETDDSQDEEEGQGSDLSYEPRFCDWMTHANSDLDRLCSPDYDVRRAGGRSSHPFRGLGNEQHACG